MTCLFSSILLTGVIYLALFSWKRIVRVYYLRNSHMWCFAPFGTICTVLKNTWKTLMEECFFNKVAGFNFTNCNTSPWVFSRFLSCTNGTKSSKVSHKNFKSPYQLFVDFIPIVVFEIWGMSLLHEAWSQAMLRGEMSLIYTSNSNNPSIEPFGRCNISYVRAELTENVPTVY